VVIQLHEMTPVEDLAATMQVAKRAYSLAQKQNDPWVKIRKILGLSILILSFVSTLANSFVVNKRLPGRNAIAGDNLTTCWTPALGFPLHVQ
jgi:hypothetical protein